MTKEISNNKRIAKNTLMLYFRTILVMLVTLYTSRVVLEQLGVEDYGIYNVVGGLVAMFSILSGSLSAAISRFLTFELGKGNIERLKTVFSTSLNVQLLIAVVIVIALELVGVWFLNNKMEIPHDRLPAANMVLHISMLTFLVNLISVPYNAAIIAHERMSAFAYVSLLEAALKLGVVYLLSLVSFDKLPTYAFLLFGVALIIRLIYGTYCSRNFEECKYQFKIDKPLLKEMFAFAGWNFIGSSSGVLKTQGVNILLNMFFGTVVNAAQGIAMQVNSAVNSFVQNFIMAMNPQITKSYARGDISYMTQLVFSGSRYGFYLLLLLSMPILIETKQILSLWLTVVPDHTVNFVRLVLVESLVATLSYPITTAMNSTGKIRNYQIVVGGAYLLNVPIAYAVLKLGFASESVFIVAVLLTILALCCRFIFFKQMELSVIDFIKQVGIKVIIILILSSLVPIALYYYMPTGILRFISVLILGSISSISFIYLFGINKSEREIVKQQIRKITSKRI